MGPVTTEPAVGRGRQRTIASTRRRQRGTCRTDPGPNAWTCRRHARSIFLCLNERIDTDTAALQRTYAALARRMGAR